MYDSVNAREIPADAELVAGYVDGLYRWTDGDWARFPNATKVRIAVFPWTNDGDVLDCETGDASPEDCPGWLARRMAAKPGRYTIYCNVSTIEAVRAACKGVPFDWWAAHYTGEPHLEPGSVACQWTDHGPANENYDISLCAAGWPA